MRAAQPDLNETVVLRPGKTDAYLVLLVWFMRKSMWWLFWIGLIVALLAEPANEIDLNLNTPKDVWDRLGSPVAGVVLALGVRLLASGLALLFAWNAARDFHESMETRTGISALPGTLQDRMNIARAFRALRWTHGVRQVAIERLGERGRQIARLDPAMDVANSVLPVIVFALIIISGR